MSIARDSSRTVAERQKAVELVAAKQAAEKDAIAITVAAEAGKQAGGSARKKGDCRHGKAL